MRNKHIKTSSKHDMKLIQIHCVPEDEGMLDFHKNYEYSRIRDS